MAQMGETPAATALRWRGGDRAVADHGGTYAEGHRRIGLARARARASASDCTAAGGRARRPCRAAPGCRGRDGPIQFGKYYWDETKGEPGPLVVTVDLTARVLSVFENGHEIGATAILKGYGDKPTPVGVFPITQKDEHHISNIFNVPMPYMMRLTNDGVSIHSSKVDRGYATNGCIGVPDGFAAKLFAKAHLGDRVIITDGKQMKIGDPIISQPKT